MKVLRKVCPHCAYVMLFSVEVLCRPHTDVEIGPACPACGRVQGQIYSATEIDMEEVTDDPDIAAIEHAIARHYEG